MYETYFQDFTLQFVSCADHIKPPENFNIHFVSSFLFCVLLLASQPSTWFNLSWLSLQGGFSEFRDSPDLWNSSCLYRGLVFLSISRFIVHIPAYKCTIIITFKHFNHSVITYLVLRSKRLHFHTQWKITIRICKTACENIYQLYPFCEDYWFSYENRKLTWKVAANCLIFYM